VTARGVYMLFVIDASGVPSMARMVTIGKAGPLAKVRGTDYGPRK